MLRVNLRNLVKSKLYIAREWHIQPSEIDKLAYYEYEQMIEEINASNKEQEKRNKEEEQRYAAMQSSIPNMNSISKNFGKNMPNMTLPKMNLPKFN